MQSSSSICEVACRIWLALRESNQPLPVGLIARKAMVSQPEAQRKLDSFIRGGFVRCRDDRYYPVWDGRKPQNVTWKNF